MSVSTGALSYDDGVADGKKKGFWNGIVVGSIVAFGMVGVTVYFMRNATDIRTAPQKAAPKIEHVQKINKNPPKSVPR